MNSNQRRHKRGFNKNIHLDGVQNFHSYADFKIAFDEHCKNSAKAGVPLTFVRHSYNKLQLKSQKTGYTLNQNTVKYGGNIRINYDYELNVLRVTSFFGHSNHPIGINNAQHTNLADDPQMDNILKIARELPDNVFGVLAVLKNLCKALGERGMNHRVIPQNNHELPALDSEQQNGSSSSQNRQVGTPEPIEPARESEKVEDIKGDKVENDAKPSTEQEIEVESDKNDVELLPTENEETESMLPEFHVHANGNSNDVQGGDDIRGESESLLECESKHKDEHITNGCPSTSNGFDNEIDENFKVPEPPLHSTLLKPKRKVTSFADDLSTISSHTKVSDGSSSVPSYLLKGDESEDDPDAYLYTYEEIVKRDEGVNISVRQQMIETLLKNTKLYEEEPITNYIDHSNGMSVSCKVADEALTRLNKVYPIQKSVWPHILNERSVMLVGNTDCYPHLVYLPPVCDLVKAEQERERQQQKEKDDDDDNSDSDDLGGPKVIILEQKRQTMEDICRIGTCYLGVIPPSSVVYFNDSYDSNGLDNEKYRQCQIFLTMPQHICMSTDPQQLFPKSVQRVVVNNFELIPSEQRKILLKVLNDLKLPFIITSRYYVDDLKQILANKSDVFVAMESYFDLYHLSTAKNKFRQIEIFKVMKTNDKCRELRRRLKMIAELEDKRVVVACTTAETAEYVSNEIYNEYHLENLLNQTPKNGSPKVLVCSDDHLLNINVKTADHIIHYDLPDDIETFSFRHIVFTQSHCKLPTIGSTATKVTNKKKQPPPPPTIPSSTIFYVPETSCEKQAVLILNLLSRKCTLNVTSKLRSQFYEMVRNMNADSPICHDISSNFSNICHLLECNDRHYLTPDMIPKVPKFVENTQCQLELQSALSPVSFEMRIHQYKDSNGIWCAWNSADKFDDFSKELNEFHAKSFNLVENVSDANRNALYVLRKGNTFMRCMILDINVPGNVQKIRVKLVDYGVQRIAFVSDFGHLDERFIEFPIQSIHVHLLNLVPWNGRSWNDDDNEYVTKLLRQCRIGEQQNRLELNVQFEVEPNSIFTHNLCSTGFDYANIITSKGIARIADSNDFIQHVEKTKIKKD